MITPNQWAAFDEFVNAIGCEDRWRFPVTGKLPRTYRELCAAGLLERNHKLAGPPRFGLTAAGRREACQRDGHHDFNAKRPAPDGCQMCDAVLCQQCEGFGSFSDPDGRYDDRDCINCGGAGLAEGSAA